MRKILALLFVILFLVNCSSVTITKRGKSKLVTQPDYSNSESFFLWGLVGEKHINVSDVCKRKSPQQLQTVFTFTDCLLGVVTLGIYAPRTAKVWCSAK